MIKNNQGLWETVHINDTLPILYAETAIKITVGWDSYDLGMVNPFFGKVTDVVYFPDYFENNYQNIKNILIFGSSSTINS